jgi:hypothetical protein
MSHFQYQCCCGEPSDACPTTCVCASSYSVTGAAINYSYQFFPQAVNCPGCGQGGCYSISYAISIAAVQTGSLVVTRQTVGASGANCCWVGDGFMEVSYTVSWQESRQCSGSRNKVWPAESYSGTTEVPCRLHVTCHTGAAEGCQFNLGNTRHYVHKLELCNFPIACQDVPIAGAIDVVSGDCGRDFSCDNLGGNCDLGPFSLWCGGGMVTYVSKYLCLNTLGVNDSTCRGFYQTGFQCGNPIDPYLDSSVVANGPFAAHLREECDQGTADPCDQAWPRDAEPAWLQTINSAGSAAVLADLRSYCAAVDTTVLSPCQSVDIIQGSCSGRIPWTYS